MTSNLGCSAVSGVFKNGKPINAELASELRQLVFGTSAAAPRGEWTRTSFVFNPPSQELAYGLRCQRNGTRGLYSVLQGFIIKYFLFNLKYRTIEEALRPNEQQQQEALLTSMVDILNIIAEKSKVIIVLPSEESFVAHSIKYFQDSVTERLYLFEMKREDAKNFLRQNLNYFTDDPGSGALLFLYSAVLTRTIFKVRADLDTNRSAYLVGPTEEGSINVITLLLTGRATPHLHNGVIHVGDESNYAIPQYGVLNRSVLGLLIWENDKIDTISRQPGSRLKTPTLPIWITSCVGHYGVIFNTNPELLRNYHAESRFDLYYYSCSGNQVKMTIDNRHQTNRATYMLQRQSSIAGKAPSTPPTSQSTTPTVSSNTSHYHDKDENIVTPLERLVHSKWAEASISFYAQPSTLSYLFSTNN